MATTKRAEQPAKSASRNAAATLPHPRHPRGTGASHVYEQLRESILGLILPPGTLLDESDLAGQFKLSRSPVREALIRLSAEGLIKTLPNRSSIVAPFDIGIVPSFLDALDLTYRATCRLAAIYRLENELEAIEVINRKLEQARAAGEITRQIALNREFHVAIAAAGGNDYFVQWIRQLLDQGQRLMRLGVYFDGEKTPKSALKPHAEMIAAIRARDPDRAEAAGRLDAEYLRKELLNEFSRQHLSSMQLGEMLS